MSDTVLASALPRKRFFLEMFTRDIPLADCILDLIDNSIDALIRRDEIDLESAIIGKSKAAANGALPEIKVKFDGEEFSIEDSCGGISLKDAREDVFNFGHDSKHDPETQGSRLGAYGIGMKRAIFKIGDEFEIESHTTKDGFRMKVTVSQWAKRDKTIDDWNFPMTPLPGAAKESSGTIIKIKRFSDSTKLAIQDPTLESQLYTHIAKTYTLFIGRFVSVSLNGTHVQPNVIPIGHAENVTPERRSMTVDGVSVRIIATLAAKTPRGTWEGESAGWYVICNGRVVVFADKTELTGWGGSIVAQFQPKFRGFIGIVNYFSTDPLKLPWTTTKRSLNRDSPVFIKIRSEMQAVAKPIIRTLESLYGGDKEQNEDERRQVEKMDRGEVGSMFDKHASSFSVSKPTNKPPPEYTQINFSVRIKELEKVRKHLRSPRMSKSKVGEHVWAYFLSSEGLD